MNLKELVRLSEELFLMYTFVFIIVIAVITTAQLHSTKSELRFCAGSNPARVVSEIHNGENL